MKTRSCIILFLLVLAGMLDAECPSGDLNGDCKVDIADVTQLAASWLVSYDMSDFAGVAADWLEEVAAGPDISWLYIDDDGSGMKDKNGDPIDKGGFVGYMSVYETTNAQYCQFLNDALASGDIEVGLDDIVYGKIGVNSGEDYAGEPYFETYMSSTRSQIIFLHGAFSVRERDGYDMGDHPVVMVSWYGAMAFANYYGWRLPTEWEWQAVADYDGSYNYGCGVTLDTSKANYHDQDYLNPLNLSAYPYTTPVGYFGEFGYGLYDMAGNASEWTSSLYNSFFDFRVFRGGCWSGDEGSSSVTRRTGEGPPDTILYYCGFRVVRDAE